MTSAQIAGNLKSPELIGFDLTMAREDLSCVFRGAVSPSEDEYKQRLTAYLDAFHAFYIGDSGEVNQLELVEQIAGQISLVLGNEEPPVGTVMQDLDVYLHGDEAALLEEQGHNVLGVAAGHILTGLLEIHRPQPVVA